MALNFKDFSRKFKKHTIPLGIAVVVVSISWYALFQHYKGVGFANEFIFKLETALLDLKFKLRGVEPPGSKVAILAIDEKTIQQFGRWPYSRKYYDQAFANLKDLGVRWIGFDVTFSEPERASVD